MFLIEEKDDEPDGDEKDDEPDGMDIEQVNNFHSFTFEMQQHYKIPSEKSFANPLTNQYEQNQFINGMHHPLIPLHGFQQPYLGLNQISQSLQILSAHRQSPALGTYTLQQNPQQTFINQQILQANMAGCVQDDRCSLNLAIDSNKLKQNILSVNNAVIREEKPLTQDFLLNFDNSERKRMLGERLYAKINVYEPRLVSKITGMILEKDNSELLILLQEQQDKNLIKIINESLCILKDHRQKQAQRNEHPDNVPSRPSPYNPKYHQKNQILKAIPSPSHT